MVGYREREGGREVGAGSPQSSKAHHSSGFRCHVLLAASSHMAGQCVLVVGNRALGVPRSFLGGATVLHVQCADTQQKTPGTGI